MATFPRRTAGALALVISICAALPARADTKTIEPAADRVGRDVGLTGTFAVGLDGDADVVLRAGYDAAPLQEFRAALTFALAGIPRGSVVQSATWSVFVSQTSDASAIEVWGYAADATVDDNDLSAGARVIAPATPTSGARFSGDVTAFVQALVDARATHAGFTVRYATQTLDSNVQFNSRELAVAERHPTLTIVYTPPAPLAVKMMPNTGTRGGDFLASDGYGSFMTTPFGQISLCWDVGFTFNPYDAALDPARAPYLPSGELDFSAWGAIYPWYGLACGDQVAIFQGAVGDTSGFSLSFDALNSSDLLVDEFRGPQRATRHSEFTLPGLPGVTVSLDQTATCASLEKVFHFTNTGDAPVTFRLDTTMDTDLQWGTREGWGEWGYCHNVGRFVSHNEVRMYARDKDIWTTIRVDPEPGDDGLTFEGCRVWANGCTGGFVEFGRVMQRHGYPPELLDGVFNSSDVSADVDPADGWQDWEGDNALTCQGTFHLDPGQTSTWRQTHSASPSRCDLAADAGPDQDVATGPLDECVANVTLDGSASTSTGAPPITFEWRDGAGALIGDEAQTEVVIGRPQGAHVFELSACDHLCQPVTSPVAIRQPSDGSVAAPCDATYCYFPAGTTDCELSCDTDTVTVDLDIDAGPSDATCDAIDDDCDGTFDEDYHATTSVCGVGRCAGTLGALECQADGGTVDTCDPLANAAASESCNGVDDDCDGTTDEGFALGAPCTVGQFACNVAGHTVCGADGLHVACDAVAVPAVSERCDHKDNDCDGVTDEDFGLGTACTVGLGACQRAGVRACVAGLAACNAPVVAGTVETCNGLDDDCDGVVDDDACPALDTRITSGPDAVTAQTSARLDYVDPVTVTNDRFECALDGGAWGACDGGTRSYSGLADGTHVFLVRAIGGDGAVDPTPAYHVWVVDRRPPDTWVLVGPEDPSQAPDADFAFGSNVAVPSAWYCALDADPAVPPVPSAAWFPCDQTWRFTGLDEGAHALAVYVVDEVGVADPTPATWRWIVDTSAPATSASGPEAVCGGHASFTFASPEPDARFVCRVDDGAWVACAGGRYEAHDLAAGVHVFEVAASDAHGNSDPTPARVLVTVYDGAPETVLTLAPDDPSQSGRAVFAFDSDLAAATFACALDGAAASACSSPFVVDGLAEGPHRFTVVASVAGCLSDETPATYAWQIDSRAPETGWVATPATVLGTADAADFAYEDPTDAALTTFDCALDGGDWFPCDGGAYAAGTLAPGPHELMVRACVRGLACDPTPVAFGWQVVEGACPADHEAPALTCPTPEVRECADGGAALGELDVRASDACEPIAIEVDGPARVPYGESVVLVEARDGNGNRASCAAVITVADRVAPTIECPADVTLVADAERCGVAYTLAAPSARDGCWPAERLALFSDAPQVFGVGTTLVTMSALDPAGNAATCLTRVTVEDNTPLTVACEAAVVREADPGSCGWTGTLSATASDNCAPAVTTIDNTNTWAVGETSVDFVATSDDSARCTTQITVKDVTAPALACFDDLPGQLVLAARDECAVTIEVVGQGCNAIDAHGVRTTLSGADCPAGAPVTRAEGGTAWASVAVGPALAERALEVTLVARATDGSGNATTRSCVVTVPASDDGTIDPSQVAAMGGGCGAAPGTWWLFGGVWLVSRRRRAAR